jgi:4-hydroxy-2-oxoheptanedioate aldolase
MVVNSAKFPPWGQRGFGSPFAMERFHPSVGASDYLQQANDAILTMVQIETKEALENVDAIAAVKGVDVLFIGPFDLGNNIGHPIIGGVMHENLHTAIATILKAAKAACKKTGIYCTSGEQSKEYADMVMPPTQFDIISQFLLILLLGLRHDQHRVRYGCPSCIHNANSEYG